MKPSYSYQKALIEGTIANLKTHGIGLVGASTGSGKTEISIEIIRDFLKRNPKKKVLFLAHGTTTLRAQVAKSLSSVSEFSSEEIVGKADTTAQVHIAIPQNKLIRTQKYGLILVDEAHQYFDAKMVQEIIASNKGARQVLLTASTGKFTQRKVPAVYFSLLEALEAGTIMEPSVGIITTKQDFRSFDAEGNLSSAEKLKEVTSIVRKFKAKAKGKTLVACHNQAAARDVAKALGKTAVLSTSELDPNNFEFNRFQDADIKYLVVVFRGVIGFSMNALETVIDLTASQNVDRITQLLGRVVRVQKGKSPLYIKLAPKLQEEWYQHVMSAVMTLAHPEVYRAWNGRIDSIKVPVSRTSIASNAVVKGSKARPNFKPKIPTWNELNNLFSVNNNLVSLNTIKSLIIGNGSDSYGKKEQLFKLAKSNASKPCRKTHNLGMVLKHYTTPASCAYDKEFADKLRLLRPDWFAHPRRAHYRKIKQIKDIFNSTKEFPTSLINPRLREYMSNLCSPAHRAYDVEFHQWALSNGYKPSGSGRKPRIIKCHETNQIFGSITIAARHFSGSQGNLSYHLSGRSATFMGFTFSYVKENSSKGK